jgi:hypothetical protein
MDTNKNNFFQQISKITLIVGIAVSEIAAFTPIYAAGFTANGVQDNISSDKNSHKILEGEYGKGSPFFLEVKGNKYKFSDATDDGGDSKWLSISELKYIKEGIIGVHERVYNKPKFNYSKISKNVTYYCLLEIYPYPNGIGQYRCSLSGWIEYK